jgi:hypothetical protein
MLYRANPEQRTPAETSSPATKPRRSPVTFKDLPSDIRRLIYPQNATLAYRHDNRLPDLLIALAPDKVFFNEALAICREINLVVTHESYGTFKLLHLKEILRF